MANIFVKREVCPTCNGEKTILCCSCGDDNECSTLVCPSCNGNGELVQYNMPAIIGVVCVGIAAAVGLFFLLF